MLKTLSLTKYAHACVKVEKDGNTLIIDPGMMTAPPGLLNTADVILITHEHCDHFDQERVLRAARQNATLKIYTCAEVAAHLNGFTSQVRIVKDGDNFCTAGFDVSVIGKDHHVGRTDMPLAENVGFLVDQEIFHPGDALTVYPVPTLLLPSQAGWMTDKEVIGYLQRVHPDRVFPIHDGRTNDWGSEELENMLSEEAERIGTRFMWLEPGDKVNLPECCPSMDTLGLLSTIEGIIDWKTRKDRTLRHRPTKKPRDRHDDVNP